MKLIDADKFKTKLLSFMDRDTTTPSDADCILDGVLNLLEEQPAETPEKYEHWIHSSSTEPLTVSCSNCGYEVNHFLSTWQTARYCPMCGAKMGEELYETNRR